MNAPASTHLPARTRLVGLLLLALLALGALAGCGAQKTESSATGAPSIFLPVVAGEAPVSAAPTGESATEPATESGAELAQAAPADVALLPAPPLVDAEGAPVPPIAPVATGELVAERSPQVEAPQLVAEPAIPPLTLAEGGDPFDWESSENYLVLGTDRRQDGGSWRTDSIMIVGLDRENERAAAFSIPRDLYVNIPGYGYGRINQADYMGERRSPDGGGPKLVGDIVESLLGVRTDHWVRIQMDGFVDFVDALGGVTVYLDCPFSEPIFNLSTQRWESFRLPAGENLLDGQDAYWFARLRYNESDIGRSRRQRALIWAMRDRITATNAITRLPQLYSAFQNTISTDLSLLKIAGLAQFALGIDAANVRAGGLTLRDLQNYTTPGGAQVLIIGNPTHVRNLVANIWEQPAMADAYRAEAAGCEPPPSVAVTAGVETQQSLPAGEPAVTEVPFAQIVAPGMDSGATASAVTKLPLVAGDTSSEQSAAGGLAIAAVAGPAADMEIPLLPPLFDPAVDLDPATGVAFDPITGFPFDPATGMAVEPLTGLPVDVHTLPPMER
jgi:LCP family protein required for cell wall assembly